MKAIEKAEELVDKMYGQTTKKSTISEIKEDKQLAKRCALIAVDELIKTEYETVKKLLEVIESKNIRLVISFNEDYWQEVKQEINKL
jgi:thymidine kinase